MPTTNHQPVIIEHGNAGPATVEHAKSRIIHALARTHEQLGPVHLSLNAAPHHRGGPQATVEVHVAVGGETICAHGSAATLPAAIAQMHDRLREQVERRHAG